MSDGDKGDVTVSGGGDVWTLNGKGSPSGLATLDSGGKVPAAQLPAIALNDTFVVASQVAMLALTAQTGDIAVRTDLSKSYILAGSNPAVLGNWQELVVSGGQLQIANNLSDVASVTTARQNLGLNFDGLAKVTAAGAVSAAVADVDYVTPARAIALALILG